MRVDNDDFNVHGKCVCVLVRLMLGLLLLINWD